MTTTSNAQADTKTALDTFYSFFELRLAQVPDQDQQTLIIPLVTARLKGKASEIEEYEGFIAKTLKEGPSADPKVVANSLDSLRYYRGELELRERDMRTMVEAVSVLGFDTTEWTKWLPVPISGDDTTLTAGAQLPS